MNYLSKALLLVLLLGCGSTEYIAVNFRPYWFIPHKSCTLVPADIERRVDCYDEEYSKHACLHMTQLQELRAMLEIAVVPAKYSSSLDAVRKNLDRQLKLMRGW